MAVRQSRAGPFHSFVILSCICGLVPSGAWAADDPPAIVLDPVKVIGVSPLPGLDVPKNQVPANVQTAGSADIDRSHAIDLTGFLNRRLGSVYVNEVQNNPFQPDVSYRGYTASPLLGTQQGLSIYLDGVRLNQPFGDVVSWDLLPKSAISTITLMPGSNPLFGLNTLGGALSVQTRDGVSHPGTSVQVLAGWYSRSAVEFETGGSTTQGLHWFVTGNRFHEGGWREDSPSDVRQLFGKVGFRSTATDVSLTTAFANTDLNGNGLQDQRLLARDYASVYTKPDNTRNRSVLFNLALTQVLTDRLTFSGNAYHRKIKTATFNADLNDDSLDQAVYQPNAAERAALIAAGYTGVPAAGENGANTPFPKWRCIANALRRDEPAEKCNGVTNETRTDQSNDGVTGQLNWDALPFGLRSKVLVGGAVDFSRSRFMQGSELGYLNPDLTVTGVGAFGDGVSGGNVDGAPYDTRVDLAGRVRTESLFASGVVELAPTTHLTVSGRYNHVVVKNRDAITPDGASGSLTSDQTFSRFNPAVGLTWSPNSRLNFYGGVNRGSRAPSSIELGCADPENPCKLPNAFAGDPPLKQVLTTTWEAGVRGNAPGAVSWNAGVFRADNRDDLLFVADNAAGFGYFRNFGRTRRQGVELGAQAEVAKGLTIGGNFTYLDATYRSPEAVDGSANSSNSSAASGFPGVEGTIDIRPGDRIPLVPRTILKLFVEVRPVDAWSLGLDMLAIGNSTARGNENGGYRADGVYYLGSGRNAGYAVFNLGTEYRPTKQWKVFAQVDNLFDRRYSTAAQLGATGFNGAGNFVARPFPADANGDRPLQTSTFYAPGAPRIFWVGVRYAFADR